MPNKNSGFSALYSPSISLSSSASKSKSNSKSKGKMIRKSKTKSKSKSKTRSKSKTQNKENNIRLVNRANTRTFGFRDITNTSRRNTTMKRRLSPQRSWRKNKRDELSLKSTRDTLSKLLYEKQWKNKIEPNDIITIQYNPIKEMHIHLYKTRNNQIGYHVKATFPLNRWSLLLQYNTTTSDYDFIVKNEMQNVIMRVNWKNQSEAIERLINFKTIQITSDEANVLLNNMLDIVTIIEKVIKTNVSGGSKNRTKTKKHKRKTKRLNKTMKTHHK
jgi:hypothetical protein